MSDWNFRKLECWLFGMDLAVDIYKVVRTFPSDERFGMIADMRKAARSVPQNIAEGQQRHTDADFAHFLDISLGSVGELVTQFELSERFGYLEASTVAPFLERLDHEGRMIRALQKKLR